MVELLKKKKDRKDKKKKFKGHRREYTKERNKQTLTTSINVIEAAPKKKLKIRCCNCDKKSYYVNNYIKSLKN